MLQLTSSLKTQPFYLFSIWNLMTTSSSEIKVVGNFADIQRWKFNYLWKGAV